MFGISAELVLHRVFSVTNNSPEASRRVVEAATQVVGAGGIAVLTRPTTSSEDFSEMLSVVPGAYFFIGHKGAKPLHHPEFLFDDGAIAVGASVLSRLVENYSEQALGSSDPINPNA